MNISIGENIKKFRNERSVTQETLAEYLDVTPQAISRWESETGYPAIEYLPNLAAFFGISVDELLGLKPTEQEARREEIYSTIAHIEECGYRPSAIRLLREAHAEFPGDRTIRFSLAKALSSTMGAERPDAALLREAEKILRDLIRQADDYDFRFACIKELAVLYKEAWQDERGYKEVLNMLPGLDSCREFFITNFYNGANQKPEDIMEIILVLVQRITCILRDYVAYTLPNETENWDLKLSHFNWIIDFCKHVGEMLDDKRAQSLEGTIAVLYRYMATYYVAQGKEEETLTTLEMMCDCVERICNRSADEKELQEHKDLQTPHSMAWYFLPYFNQARYDPVRNNRRFSAVIERMTALAW